VAEGTWLVEGMQQQLHYRKINSCHEPSILPGAFCRTHGKIAFWRRPNFKLTANRLAHGKISLPRGAFGKQVFCREPFVADGNMLFCRELLTAKVYFAATFYSG
jgi:hypothetical protein